MLRMEKAWAPSSESVLNRGPLGLVRMDASPVSTAPSVRAATAEQKRSVSIRSARLVAGDAQSGLDTEALAEVVAAMFEGLQIRAVRNPDLDAERVTALYRHLLRDLLTA